MQVPKRHDETILGRLLYLEVFEAEGGRVEEGLFRCRTGHGRPFLVDTAFRIRHFSIPPSVS